MPRLSHSLALTPLGRADLARTVSSAYGVLRGARFGEDGLLVLPSEKELRRLELRAEELGLTLDQGERTAHEHGTPDPWEESVRTGEPGSTEREIAAQDLADEAAIEAAEPSLRLLSGEHLAPGSTYLVTEVDPEGRPVFVSDGEGWVGTDLTVASWDESGVCAVDFAMREEAGTGGASAEDDGEAPPPPAGWCTTAPGRPWPSTRNCASRYGVPWHAGVRTCCAPGYGSGWTCPAGSRPPPARRPSPVTLEVEHPLVRARGEASPRPEPTGRGRSRDGWMCTVSACRARSWRWPRGRCAAPCAAPSSGPWSPVPRRSSRGGTTSPGPCRGSRTSSTTWPPPSPTPAPATTAEGAVRPRRSVAVGAPPGERAHPQLGEARAVAFP
ncbi:hypothetical protein KGD82_09705 [Nocardiopsis eucommiae]|uniref:Uncharacterized protein n=1 Tax=Nocardiopsis eucommiae TaxID=2831970 RepID=A0A975LB72_9ACTN|nr:hypothetical protein KGD82_09705 [Nocardiopsis eucommiae]